MYGPGKLLREDKTIDIIYQRKQQTNQPATHPQMEEEGSRGGGGGGGHWSYVGVTRAIRFVTGAHMMYEWKGASEGEAVSASCFNRGGSSGK